MFLGRVYAKRLCFGACICKGAERGLLLLLSPQVSPLFGTIYNSILYLAHTRQRMRTSGKWGVYGGNLVPHAHSLSFQGFSHPVQSSGSGASLLHFVILDTDGLSGELRPTHRVELESDMVRYLGSPIHFPNGVAPKTDSTCWFTHGIICSGG